MPSDDRSDDRVVPSIRRLLPALAVVVAVAALVVSPAAAGLLGGPAGPADTTPVPNPTPGDSDGSAGAGLTATPSTTTGTAVNTSTTASGTTVGSASGSDAGGATGDAAGATATATPVGTPASRATGVSTGASGSASATVRVGGPDRHEFRDDVRSIAAGDRVYGTIDEADPRSDAYRGYHEPITFEGSAGETISVRMTAAHRGYRAPPSSAADLPDPYLLIVGPDGDVIARNDDADHGFDARVSGVVLPADGEYTVVATSYGANQTFRYALGLRTASESTADLRSIDLNATATGAIDKSDPFDGDRRGFYEPVTFRGSAGQTVRIEMGSGTGDTYLRLLGPDGSVVAENDDGGQGLNATIERATLPSDGEYTVVATSYSPIETFRYRLSVEVIGSGAPGGADLRSIDADQTVSSRLDEGDPTAGFLRGHYEPVTFRGRAGQSVTIEMTSQRGDPYLFLYGPDGDVVARNDDVRGLNARIRTDLPASGEYTIVATSYDPDATFDYELSLATGSPDWPDLRSISYGETRQGGIDREDPASRAYRGHYEPVTFEGSAGDRVTVDMTSDGDPYLLLLAPNGTVLAENDDARGLDSRITATLPTDGEYTIVATSYDPRATFAYELSLVRASVDTS
ncbi:MAG: PPC domain-containing protein [Haloarculaceae archaeon]